VAKFKHRHSNNQAQTLGHYSQFLSDPAVSLSLLVLGLVAVVLAIINFVQAMYLY